MSAPPAIRVVTRLQDQDDVGDAPSVQFQVPRWNPGSQTYVHIPVARKQHEDIVDYGAVGNGAVNSTAAIVAAIAAAKAPGGTRRVFVPGGTFLTDPITGLTENMEIYGTGQGSVLKSRTGGDVIAITAPNDAIHTHIHDLTIEGSGTAAAPIPANTGCGLYFHDGGNGSMHHCRWTNLWIRYCGGHGICLGTKGVDPRPGGLGDPNAVWSSLFENINIEDCGDHHFRASNVGPSTTLLNVWSTRWPSNGSHTPGNKGYAFAIYSGHCELICCNAGHLNASTGGMFYFGPGISNFTMHSCTAENIRSYGIYLDNCTSGLIEGTVMDADAANSIPIFVDGDSVNAIHFGRNYFIFAAFAPSHNEILHVSGFQPIVVSDIKPATCWDADAGASRSVPHLDVVNSATGREFALGSVTATSNTTVRRGANAEIKGSQFVAASSEAGGFVFGDTNWQWFRDDNNLTGFQFSLVTKGFGAGTRKHLWCHNDNTPRMGLHIENLRANTAVVEDGLFITPQINQSGGAGYNGLRIDVTENSIGGGTNRLINAKLGGVAKFQVARDGGVGFYGVNPPARPALPAAATDAATTQNLANAMRAALINCGLAS